MAEVQLMVFFIFSLELLENLQIVIFVVEANPHVETAAAVPTSVAGEFADWSVAGIIRLEHILWVMTPHAYLCFIADSISFPDGHPYVTRASRGVAMEVVIIEVAGIAF